MCSRQKRCSSESRSWASVASTSALMSMKAMEIASISPASSRIGLAVARTWTFRPSCRWMTMSSTTTVSAAASACTKGIRSSG